MKKLSWCLLPLVGLLGVACGGEGPISNSSSPPNVQDGDSGPNGEQTGFQPAVGGEAQSCQDLCEDDADRGACEAQCRCDRAVDSCEVCLCDTDDDFVACADACAAQ